MILLEGKQINWGEPDWLVVGDSQVGLHSPTLSCSVRRLVLSGGHFLLCLKYQWSGSGSCRPSRAGIYALENTHLLRSLCIRSPSPAELQEQDWGGKGSESSTINSHYQKMHTFWATNCAKLLTEFQKVSSLTTCRYRPFFFFLNEFIDQYGNTMGGNLKCQWKGSASRFLVYLVVKR